MAVSTRHLCRGIRQIGRNNPVKRQTLQCIRPRQQHQHIRPFSSSITTYADDPAISGKAPSHFSASQPQPPQEPEPQLSARPDELHESEYLIPEKPYTVSDLSPEERADYEVLPTAERAGYLALQNHVKALFETEEAQAELEAIVDQADREIDREGGPDVALDFPQTRAKGMEIGYWAEDEEDEFGQMEDADDEVSDEHITSVAESELDLHRDIREYTRIAAWDLPLLQRYAKRFQPPTHATPLRFRYTTHMGESHPSQSKVVVELSTKDLLSHPSPSYKISEAQRSKLIKLAGVRYNPSTDVIKMSSEKFETGAQNKRYLGELVGSLIKEAKDKRDMFTDVPFDFRHHKKVNKPQFPEEWKMSNKRVKSLADTRKEVLLLEGEEPIDGGKVVEDYVRVGQLRQAQLLRA